MGQNESIYKTLRISNHSTRHFNQNNSLRSNLFTFLYILLFYYLLKLSFEISKISGLLKSYLNPFFCDLYITTIIKLPFFLFKSNKFLDSGVHFKSSRYYNSAPTTIFLIYLSYFSQIRSTFFIATNCDGTHFNI